MEQIKCFSEDHKEIDAICFCPECKINMCNKCSNTHSSFFKNHNCYKLNKDEEIFTGFCQEKNHPMKLEYYCKIHNKLCCAACLCKLNQIGDGQHKDCDVCIIKNIKDDKKEKLKENINLLEKLDNNFNNNMKEIKEIFQKIEKDKDELKLKIQNIFTKIRNALNEREEELLLEIDNIYNNKYLNDDIIKKVEKLPKKIKISLEKGKLLDKEWDENHISSYVNDCINIENNIKTINIINEKINIFNKNNNINIIFRPDENSLNNFLETVKSFGKLYDYNELKYSFRECPPNMKENRKYIVTGENKNIITKIGNDDSMGTICEQELDKSIEEHKWKIKILKTKSREINVGVAPIDFDILSTQHYGNCGWYLFCGNLTLYSGPPFNYNNKETNLSKIKDEVIVIMNMKKRTLKFIINNEDKGDSYTDIPIDKPFFPAVLLYNKDDSVEITGIL